MRIDLCCVLGSLLDSDHFLFATGMVKRADDDGLPYDDVFGV